MTDRDMAAAGNGTGWPARQLRSTVRSSGEVELALVPVTVSAPGADEVVVRIEAAPINPSDITPMLGGADPAALVVRADGQAATGPVPSAALTAFAGRINRAIDMGTEGAGVVVAAGASPAAQRLLGRTVALFAEGLYAQYRCVPAAACVALPPGITPAQGASFFVNPLTALGLVETARRDGFTALAQTAAASNLGQMIVRLCRHDAIPLVNIVRGPAQAAVLHAIGATHVCDSSAPGFDDDLHRALDETGATAAFDAIGGGDLANRLLAAMEKVAMAQQGAYHRYGTNTRKHVYIYGMLDRRPTELRRNYGFGWSVGGWLLTPFLDGIGTAAADALRARVADEITTTFASRYSHTVTLDDLVRPEIIQAFAKRATGEKYLVAPAAGLPADPAARG